MNHSHDASSGSVLARVVRLMVPHRWLIAVALLLLALESVAAVLPPLLAQRVFDEVLFPRQGLASSGPTNFGLLVLLAGAMVGLAALAALISILEVRVSTSVGASVGASLQRKIHEQARSLSLDFFTSSPQGMLQSRLLHDVSGAKAVLTASLSILTGNLFAAVAAFVAMVSLDWRLALISLAIAPLILVAQRGVGRNKEAATQRFQQSLDSLTTLSEDRLGPRGALLTRIFNRTSFEAHVFDTAISRHAVATRKLELTGQKFFAVTTAVVTAVPALVYLTVGLMNNSAAGPTVQAGTIVAFAGLHGRLVFPMLSLAQLGVELRGARAYFVRIFDFLDTKSSFHYGNERIPAETPVSRRGAVEFDMVSYDYPSPGGSHKVLDNLTFRIAPSTLTAIIGPSGAGKTTLAYLVAGLFQPTSGVVRLSGADQATLSSEAISDEVCFVPQEPFFIEGTIRENFRYAAPEASQDLMLHVCELAGVVDRIRALDDGLDAQMGAAGARFSGGERQRLALARALLRGPRVLVLDEPTSALDPPAQSHVLQSIRSEMSDRTVILISHRRAPVLSADCIFVLESGRIIDTGTPTQLISRNKYFQSLSQA